MMASKYSTLSFPLPQTDGTPLNLTLKPVISESDVFDLATINDRALDADTNFKQWMALFTERTDWSTTVQAVKEALSDPDYRLVKAVVPGSDSDNDEKIVGFIHWFCGWIQLEQVDPFASQASLATETATDIKDVASNMAETLAKEAADLKAVPESSQEDLVRARRLKKGERKYVETRNHYISAIRGKRHMFIRRIMVLPDYQGMGIGKKLMKVVTDEADRLKIVCWLFARPGGVPMYKKLGYEVAAVTDMHEPEENFECPETLSMIRFAQPVL